MSTLPKSRLTEEEYLEIERKAEFKSEYFRGEMFAMAGAQRPHLLIAGNVFGELRRQLLDKDCEVYSSDARVCVTKAGLYTYPDVVVVCGEPKYREDGHVDTLLNPIVIVEVLSSSTENRDRGQKLTFYRQLDSLAEYLLVSSLEVNAELYQRQPSGLLTLGGKNSLEDAVDLQSIGCRLTLSEIYRRVKFPTKA